MINYKHYSQSNGQQSLNILKDCGDGRGYTTCIPNDPNNADWQEYQLWLAQGNTPEAAD